MIWVHQLVRTLCRPRPRRPPCPGPCLVAGPSAFHHVTEYAEDSRQRCEVPSIENRVRYVSRCRVIYIENFRITLWVRNNCSFSTNKMCFSPVLKSNQNFLNQSEPSMPCCAGSLPAELHLTQVTCVELHLCQIIRSTLWVGLTLGEGQLIFNQ